MITTQAKIAAVFNEWQKRYSANPGEFDQILDENGEPITDYGARCARYFQKLSDELDSSPPLQVEMCGRWMLTYPGDAPHEVLVEWDGRGFSVVFIDGTRQLPVHMIKNATWRRIDSPTITQPKPAGLVRNSNLEEFTDPEIAVKWQTIEDLLGPPIAVLPDGKKIYQM